MEKIKRPTTVGELMEKLSKFPSDQHVCVYTSHDDGDDVRAFDIFCIHDSWPFTDIDGDNVPTVAIEIDLDQEASGKRGV